MSRKPEKNYTQCYLDGTKTKLLTFWNKPQIHKVINWNPQGDKI